jgi:hypothetical protein
MSFVEPNSADTILSAVDVPGLGFALADFGLSDPVDFSELTEVAGGVEVQYEGDWIAADFTSYDPEIPLSIAAGWFEIPDLIGLPWRLTAPVTGWTAGGRPLLPASGVFTTAPLGRAVSAKIADAYLLQKDSKVR